MLNCYHAFTPSFADFPDFKTPGPAHDSSDSEVSTPNNVLEDCSDDDDDGSVGDDDGSVDDGDSVGDVGSVGNGGSVGDDSVKSGDISRPEAKPEGNIVIRLENRNAMPLLGAAR